MNTQEIIKHLIRQRQSLEDAIAALNGGHPKMRKKKMSEAARRRISMAQKRRWKALRAKAKA